MAKTTKRRVPVRGKAPVKKELPARARKPSTLGFGQVLEELKGVLKPYAGRLRETPAFGCDYGMLGAPTDKYPEGMCFAGTAVRKGYVSLYLLPVYMHPELMSGASPALKARQQGKSCFNFRKIDPGMRKELAGLVKASFESFKTDGFVS